MKKNVNHDFFLSRSGYKVHKLDFTGQRSVLPEKVRRSYTVGRRCERVSAAQTEMVNDI